MRPILCVWGRGAAVVGRVGKEIAQIHSTRRHLALSILLGCWKPLQGTQTREPQAGRPGEKAPKGRPLEVYQSY